VFTASTNDKDLQPGLFRETILQNQLMEARLLHKNMMEDYIEYKIKVADTLTEADRCQLKTAQVEAENKALKASLREKNELNESLSRRLAEAMKIIRPPVSSSDQLIQEKMEEDLKQYLHRTVSNMSREENLEKEVTPQQSADGLLQLTIHKLKRERSELLAEKQVLAEECNELRARVHQDKLDPLEVKAALNQIRGQLRRKLKEKTSRCLELELNLSKVVAERDDWQKHAEMLSEELNETAVENKNLQDCISRFRQFAQQLEMEKDRLIAELKKFQSALTITGTAESNSSPVMVPVLCPKQLRKVSHSDFLSETEKDVSSPTMNDDRSSLTYKQKRGCTKERTKPHRMFDVPSFETKPFYIE